MKICVLVKEVPDAAVQKRIDPSTGRMDRGVWHLFDEDTDLHFTASCGKRAFVILPY